jgi:hypothetical protein
MKQRVPSIAVSKTFQLISIHCSTKPLLFNTRLPLSILRSSTKMGRSRNYYPLARCIWLTICFEMVTNNIETRSFPRLLGVWCGWCDSLFDEPECSQQPYHCSGLRHEFTIASFNVSCCAEARLLEHCNKWEVNLFTDLQA